MSKIEDIKKSVDSIRNDLIRNRSKEDIEKKYKKFIEDYPKLFVMIVENSPGYMEILNRMFEGAKLIEDGDSTQDDMDKVVGLELAKEYVYPIIDMTKEPGIKY
jgi:hypothetical protein